MQNIEYRLENNHICIARKIKFVFLAIFYILYSIFSGVAPAFAHILLTDGSIGAVMHINPEDDPIVEQPASFFFEFKDKENKFRPEDCYCTVSVIKGATEVFSADLFSSVSTPALDNASFVYTFPERSVYHLVINGKPKTAGEFKPFRLESDLRVERTSSTSAAGQNSNQTNWFASHVIHLIGGAVIFGILLGLVIKKRLENKTNG